MEEMRNALMRGEKVFVVMGDKFFKASLSGLELKMSFLPMTMDEVLSEINNRLKPDWC